MTNEISVKLPSQSLITKINTSFEKDFDHLSMDNRSEAAKFEPDTEFENTRNEIKDNHLKSINSAATNPSSIKSVDDNSDPLCINKSFEAEKFER